MLVLARRIGEEIVIDGDIRVSVLEVRGSQVRLGIIAPQDVRVLRQELEQRPALLADASLARVLSEAKQASRSDSGIMASLVHIAR